MSSVLYCNGKSSFHSHLTEMSQYFNLPDFNTDLLDTATKNFVGLMKQRIYIILAKQPHHSQKLEFFRSFKSNHTISN